MRIKEYKNQKRMEELEEKDKKIEEFKIQKLKVMKNKAETSAKIQKEKEEIILKFEQRKKETKEIDCELIKELFPEDIDLYLRMKVLQNEGLNHSQSSDAKSTDFYRDIVSQQLEQKIQREKINEQNRQKRYDDAKDDESKKLIEIQNAHEREISLKEIELLQSKLH